MQQAKIHHLSKLALISVIYSELNNVHAHDMAIPQLYTHHSVENFQDPPKQLNRACVLL